MVHLKKYTLAFTHYYVEIRKKPEFNTRFSPSCSFLSYISRCKTSYLGIN